MKISIVTVCFNSAHTIADTMRSVAEQSHPDVEHIVIDGGSTDGTIEIARAFSERVMSEQDAGIYDAMNKGLRLATGDFVGFLNADDILAGPDVVACIAAIADEQRADAVYGDLCYVQKERPSETLRYWQSGEFHPSRLRYGWMPPHPTFYVRRSTLSKFGEFDLRFRIAADYDFMLRFLSQPNIRVHYIQKVLVLMRAGGASNRSLGALLRKSREDLEAVRKNRIGGITTLVLKMTRKLPQFILRPRASLLKVGS